MKEKKVLLIIPAYNEEENILKTYQDILEYNKKYKKNFECIIINDGSKDRTGEILDKNSIPHVDLIENLGIGGAVQTGYLYAKQHLYDIAIQYDGDGQHDIHYVDKLIEPILKNEADFVIGSRFIENVSEFKTTFARRAGIRVISFFIRLKSGKRIYDTTSGFRACNREIINVFASDYPQEYPEPITTVEIIKQGFQVKEVAVNMKERAGGKSSIHTWKEAYYMLNVCLSILTVGSRRKKCR